MRRYHVSKKWALDYIASRLDELRELAQLDEEAAHGLENDLHILVMTWIARKEIAPSAHAAVARAALRSREIRFNRWCA